MAYKVKCAVTGEWGTSDKFVKHGNRYYKDEKVYEEYVTQNEFWKKMIDKFCYDFLDYQEGQPFPTILTKRLKELDFYDNETLYRTMCDEKVEEGIAWATQNIKFDNDYMKISYIMAIIRNNVARIWKIVIKERKADNRPYMPIPSSLYSSLQDIQNPKQKVKDISKFVED